MPESRRGELCLILQPELLQAMANVQTSACLSFKEYEPYALVVTEIYHLYHFTFTQINNL